MLGREESAAARRQYATSPLRFGVDADATCLFDFGLGVSTVRRFTGSLLPWLGNVGSALRQILPMLLLLVNDFLVVRYISWIGHD